MIDLRLADERLRSRRAFIAAAAVSLALVLLPRRAAATAGIAATGKHPDPRQGVDASRMPSAEVVAKHGDGAVAAFAEARQIPAVLDGIRCNCGCADADGMRSLLSCYEGPDAMALDCHICQGQGRLAFKLKEQGRSLDEIRVAVDKRYG